MKETNAIITSTRLGYEKGSILDAALWIEDAHTAQCFGGWTLNNKPADGDATHTRRPSIVAGVYIEGVLRAVGADSWEKLKGMHIRVRRDNEYGRINAIGHIIKDTWFAPEEALKKYLSYKEP